MSGKKVNYVCEKKEVENHQPTVNYIKSLTGFDIKSFDWAENIFSATASLFSASSALASACTTHKQYIKYLVQ